MSAADVCFMPARALARGIAQRDLSPVEVVDAFLRRIEERNPSLRAYVTVCAEEARSDAAAAEAGLRSGAELGPLHGVPIALKDLGDLKAGVRNTYGSLVFSEFVPEATAAHVARLERAGAIVLGKTNCCEFGTNPTTDNRVFDATSTPFAIGKNAGGSSGGSAAAVADGLAALAIGGDAGGSIRIPAALCGVVGYKPTFGYVAAVSRPNAFNYQTPFSHLGPLGRTVGDVALALEVLRGRHPRDPYSYPVDSAPLEAIQRPASGLRVALSLDLGIFPVQDEVRSVVADACGALELAGATVIELPEPVLRRPLSEFCDAWKVLFGVRCAAMTDSYLEQGLDLLGQHRGELTPELTYFVELGRSVSAVEYRRLDSLRSEILDAFEDVFEEFDLLATPTVSVDGVDNGTGDGVTRGPSIVDGIEVDPALGWCLTFPANMTGHPAISVPAGLSSASLPIGLQLFGRRFEDDTVLTAAAALERVRGWSDWYPPPAMPSEAVPADA